MGEGAQTGDELQRRNCAPQSHAAMSEIAFDPAQPKAAFAQLPHTAAVFVFSGSQLIFLSDIILEKEKYVSMIQCDQSILILVFQTCSL